MKINNSYHIGNWKISADKVVSVGDFNNVTDTEKFGVFPGKYEGDSAFTVVNNDAKAPTEIDYNAEDYVYSYTNDEYFYGITKENTEIIAAKTADGKLIPMLKGAGGFCFKRAGKKAFAVTGVKDYSVDDSGKYTKVTVNYKAEGEFDYTAEVSNTYTFKSRSFEVDSLLHCMKLTGDIDTAYFGKEYLSDSDSYTKKVSFRWDYPENNDFEFKNFDAIVIAERFGNYALYSSIRDENCDGKVFLRALNPSALPIEPKFCDDFKYNYHMECAVLPVSDKETYLGKFKSSGKTFAAGIASVNETDNSTMFMGKKLHLNLNVANLKDDELNFTARYQIIDYYENIVDEKIYYSNILSVGGEANRNIELELPKYGMYYLNFYVTDGENEYKETYPFCMVEEFDFKYRDENRFGICATHHETIGEGRTTAKICGKMGLSLTRDGRHADSDIFHKYLIENGVKRYSGVGADTQDPAGIIWAKTPDEVDRMMKEVKLSEYMMTDEHCAYFFIANEIDAPAKGNYEKSYKLLTETYIPYTFKPIYDFVKENHPEALDKMIWQSNCHGTSEWLEAYHDTGMVDNSAIIDIHSYSSPSGPDKMYSNTRVSMHANTFSNEYAMDRWKRYKKRYGEKRMMVGETGYPCAPYIGNRCEVDPRTVADFNVRIAMFFLEAGAEDIIYYSIYDRTRNFIGASKWNELYFGAFYNYDYYGVYMPKPWAAAYANLTRRMDGHTKVSFFDKYEESEFGTLRAFEVETKTDRFAVLWSNVFQQPNTTAEGRMRSEERKPLPIWANRWEETETREFDAVGDTVTVVDIMGNATEIKAVNGKVELEISGSPIYVYGIK